MISGNRFGPISRPSFKDEWTGESDSWFLHLQFPLQHDGSRSILTIGVVYVSTVFGDRMKVPLPNRLLHFASPPFLFASLFGTLLEAHYNRHSENFSYAWG
ncbi:hypothetical protein NPIL_252701 [Nephila pilipes]|uniref:Uncharacterized protein n=1 Tax=Nephila pilipes TaxID=299642 RepID=A0A8X6MQE4_NEPPI|nr:hypothetical protein NPIL_252701 [Nephila pilipes]